MKTYRTSSSEETRKLGAKLALRISLLASKNKRAFVVALKGDLGSGKTTFAQGFMRALGVRLKISSPTFVLMKRFKLKSRSLENAYHIDCYRVKNSRGLSSLGLKEIFSNPKNVVLIEWPERLKSSLLERDAQVGFRHGKALHERILTLRSKVAMF